MTFELLLTRTAVIPARAETASLRQVYKLLADQMGKNIFFDSFSVDPKHDTHELLKEYAERFKIQSDTSLNI